MNEVPSSLFPDNQGDSARDETSCSKARQPGRARRWIRRCVVTALVLGVVGSMLPALVSTFGGRFWFAGTLSSRFDADVDIGSLSLSWTSEQKIEGLRIEGAHSPHGHVEDGSRRFLEVPHATMRTTLWNLLFTKRPLVLEISGARVHLQRHEDGEFNVAGIFDGDEDESFTSNDDEANEPSAAEKIASPAEAGLRAVRAVVRSPRPSGWLPDLGRRVEIEIRDAELQFDDRVVDARIRIRDVDAKLIVGPKRTSFSLSGDVVRHGAAFIDVEERPSGESALIGGPGGHIEISATGSGWNTSLEELEAGGYLEVSGLALAPYASMLREYIGFEPPDAAFALRLDADTIDGSLRISLGADADTIEIRDAELELPLVGYRRPARLEVPLSVEIGPTLLALRDHIELPVGATVGGLVSVVVEAGHDLSVEALRDLGWAALEGLTFTSGVESPDFALRMPTSGETPDVLSASISGLASLDAAMDSAAEKPEPSCRVELRGVLTGFGDHRHAPPGHIQVDGELEVVGDLEYGDVRARRLSTRYSMTGGTIALREVVTRVAGGEIRSPRAWIDLERVPATYGFDLELVGLEASEDMAPLLAYAVPIFSLDDRRAELVGRLDGSLEIRGKGLEPGDAERYLVGRGELRLSGGALQGSRVLRQLGIAVARPLDRVVFDEFRARYEIGDGRIVTREVHWAVEAGRSARDLGWTGATTFRSQLEHRIELALLEEAIPARTSGDLRLRKALRTTAAGSTSRPDELGGGPRRPPLRLTGTLREPVVSLSPIPGVSIPAEHLLDVLLER